MPVVVTAATLSMFGCGGDEPLRGWADADVEVIEEGEASGQADVIISGSDVVEPMRNTDLDTTDSLEIVEDEGIVIETDGEGTEGTLKSSLEPQEVDPVPSERMPAQLGSPTPSAASSSSRSDSADSSRIRRAPAGEGSATDPAPSPASPASPPAPAQGPEPETPEPAEEPAGSEPDSEPAEEEEEEPQSDEPQLVTSIRR